MPSDLHNQFDPTSAELISRWEETIAEIASIEKKLHALEGNDKGNSETDTDLTQRVDELLMSLNKIALTICDRPVNSSEDACLLARVVSYYSDPEANLSDQAAFKLAQAVLEQAPRLFAK